MAKRGRRRAQAARDRPQAQAQGAVRLTYPTGTWGVASYAMATSEQIYSAVTRIANALACMPFHLYKGYDIQRDDPREVMLNLRPNRRQSAFAFKQAMEIARNTEGRAYAAKRFDARGDLRALVPLDPARVTPLIDEETGDIWYKVIREDRVEEYLHQWYVLALHHASTDGVTGVRVVDVLSGTLEYDAKIKTFSLEKIKGVNQAIVLEYPSTMGPDARKRAALEFIEIYQSSGGQVIALENGVKATALQMSPIDAKAFDVENATALRVATVYNLPPYMLGCTNVAAPGTAEERILEFLALTMNAPVQMWEEALNWALLTPEERKAGMHWEIDIEAYLRTSPKTRADIAQQRMRGGQRTPNELRAAANLPPMEGGDELYASKDLAPLRWIAQGATIDANAIAGEHNAAHADSGAEKTQREDDGA